MTAARAIPVASQCNGLPASGNEAPSPAATDSPDIVTAVRRSEAGAAEGMRGFPVALTSFVGRAQAVADVPDRLRQCRLVTVTGPGGAGKTRLAGEVASRVAGRFADEGWPAELPAVQDPALAATAVAAALRIRDLPAVAAADALANVARSPANQSAHDASGKPSGHAFNRQGRWLAWMLDGRPPTGTQPPGLRRLSRQRLVSATRQRSFCNLRGCVNRPERPFICRDSYDRSFRGCTAARDCSPPSASSMPCQSGLSPSWLAFHAAPAPPPRVRRSRPTTPAPTAHVAIALSRFTLFLPRQSAVPTAIRGRIMAHGRGRHR
jgi:hypothetical protein